MIADESGSNSNKIKELLLELRGDDPARREQARNDLVRYRSRETVAALVVALTDPSDQVRWEAAKVLSAIADPVTAPALLCALDDENGDVRWVAGEGLIAMGRTGLLTVLQALTKNARSVDFCNSAHHVLSQFASQNNAAALAPVLAALEESEPALAAPPAAYDALMKLKNNLA